MEDLERPQRAVNTRDVDAQPDATAGAFRGRVLRAVLIGLALLIALAVLLATGVIEH